MNRSIKEENYLKAIYLLGSSEKNAIVSATDIANWLQVKPPTVLEKLKDLVTKGLISYNKKEGAKLSKNGFQVAVNIVRRHRIWETYLYKELNFSWSEIHEIAEQLEHVHSEKLIDKIYSILGQPEFDPHGDPIPDKLGVLPQSERRPLSKSYKGCRCKVLGVTDDNVAFLNYLTDLKIGLNDKLLVEQLVPFDESLKIVNKHKEIIHLSAKAASRLMVSCLKPNCPCKTP